MSALPVTEFCGRAASLDIGSGRAAAIGTAFHALCNSEPYALEGLTPEERETVRALRRPEPFTVNSVELLYEDAERELEVAIDADGQAVPANDPRAISVGHLDMAWTVEHFGQRLAVIGDIKRSEWTTEDGPDSLQLLAYGFAYAALRGATHFITGIWAAAEGRWWWGEMVEVESFEAAPLWRRVRHAATNTGGDFAMGSHCRRCYGRPRCPAYLLPPEHAETSLAPFTAPGAITPDNALHLKLLVDRASATVEAAEKLLRDYARISPIPDGKGKVWGPVMSKGRESVSVAAVRERWGAEAEAVISRGKDYPTFRWVKA